MKSKWKDTLLSLNYKKKMRKWINREDFRSGKEGPLRNSQKVLWCSWVFLVKFEKRVRGTKKVLENWHVWGIFSKVFAWKACREALLLTCHTKELIKNNQISLSGEQLKLLTITSCLLTIVTVVNHYNITMKLR